MELENLGSLITIKDTNNCLGYLMDFKDKGVYATHGKVDVSPEDASTHNRLLDEAMLKGLDDNCQVGQGGSFYTGQNDNGRTVIKTFMGTLVSADTSVKTGRIHPRTGRKVVTLTFRRAGKVYRGRVSHEHDLFNFRRVK